MASKNVSLSINRKNKTHPYHITEINVPKKAEVMDIIVMFDDDTQILFLIDDAIGVKYEKRKFLSIKLGVYLPKDMDLVYLGTAVIQKGHIVEQVYEIIK